MNSIIKTTVFISVLFTLFTIPVYAAGDYVTPDRYQVTEVMNDYNVTNQNNSLQLACEIGQYVSENYNWNCDIRQLSFTSHKPEYVNVFYPAADNKKGYEAYYGWFGPQKKEVTGFTGKDKAMYYRNWGSDVKAGCRINGVCSFNIVKSYFGNTTKDVTEVNDTEVNETEVNETVQPSEPVETYTQDNETTYVSNNSSVTTTVLTNDTISNTVENSTNTVNNQGYVGKVIQYFIDLKNANMSNVSFNFWG